VREGTPYTPPPQQDPSLSLAELVPHRFRSEALRAHNPFTATISEKHASRFYQAVDERKTVAEIMTQTRLSAIEVVNAVRTLLAQQLIQLYDTTDKPVDSSRLPDLL
jgi:hypothetical protein